MSQEINSLITKSRGRGTGKEVGCQDVWALTNLKLGLPPLILVICLSWIQKYITLTKVVRTRRLQEQAILQYHLSPELVFFHSE